MASRSLGSKARRAALGVFLPMLVGCAVVPRNKLEETQSTNRELRTALAEAKDSIAKLKTQNRDLAARSMEESRRNIALEEANERFEHDIMTYQEEREQYAAALDQIKSQVLASSERAWPSASLQPVDRFLAEHPGSSFDAATGRLSLPVSGFFQPGTAELLPKAKADLDRMVKSLASSDLKEWSIRVIASGDEGPGVALSRENLGQERVEQVKNRVVSAGFPAKTVTTAVSDPSVVRVVARNRSAGTGP